MIRMTADSHAHGPHPEQLSIDVAHELMQQHLRCATDRCTCRRAALDVLVGAGHYVLAADARRSDTAHRRTGAGKTA